MSLKGFNAPLDKSKTVSRKQKGVSHGLVPNANSGKLNVPFESGTKGVHLNGK